MELKEVYYLKGIDAKPKDDNLLPQMPQEYLDCTPVKLFNATIKSINHYVISHDKGYDFRLKKGYSHDVFMRICRMDIDKYGK